MPTYSGRIVRELGGSLLRVASGRSLFGSSGGKVDFSAGTAIFGTLEGNTTFSGALTVSSAIGVGAGATAACIASSKLKLGTDIASSGVIGVFEVMDFGNGVKFFLARTTNEPSAAGSPGSLMLRLPGTGNLSAIELYIKRGDNSPASGNWVAFQTTASAG